MSRKIVQNRSGTNSVQALDAALALGLLETSAILRPPSSDQSAGGRFFFVFFVLFCWLAESLRLSA
jgi:hypothetical protein